ncbi:mannose-1-phosphate guanylyltransferase/mannose-6-phosphate isomerase [Burkholderia oklahomensis]|uniref:mannose-1-phosphate guanylyltransferase/mannose-6-phosphate isomerase n=1 Tax=Burkholderia oklahomensis TaxID=342113 RepID=UPI00030C6E89|nr:mannose-1-phosphate guanylyltransferase/mannose-6-phosphate isomerase [Burkholderia oklahomensis]AJX32054.1 mannose-1-phosphate guanylyltransferase/mannose-6-phosphate isomerase [Burkholderia oklahomensis C6786]AOI47635.1 mannose-1-phosphate guanyltransferase [Burkholderia oklahomensis C6786]KUY65811.1 mannose-1-phosphate guanyltransferase [Burkholderia oklahomensis C6786]MBI0358840.1 mannose-1-phosphate guanylyltransferase/mannose-6-phosphate isomerase [Burkholderia oklahomensis]SUW57334.1
MKLIPVIMSGGSGSRLWPQSRERYPKPFLSLPDGSTLIQRTYERAASLPGVEHLFTVTNKDLYFLTQDHYAASDCKVADEHYILEPFGRDTAAAVALATLEVARNYNENVLLLVLAADHLIENQAAFRLAVSRAMEIASTGRIVTFGIRPTHPETGFGYIEADDENVLRFVEKPDYESAVDYVKSGRFYWNSGMFCFGAGVMLAAMEEHCPELLAGAKRALEQSRVDRTSRSNIIVDDVIFAAVPSISIDYAVMEKADNVAVVACDCGWSDIGSWSGMADLLDADEHGNRVLGEARLLDAKNCYVNGGNRMIGLLGVSDLVVVDTQDALLIAHRERVQDVKAMYGSLRTENHEAAMIHRTAHRPWGTYTVLEDGTGFKIKRIEVKPGGRLSLQAHFHRAEHWIVVSGSARVTNGEQEMLLTQNQSTYIPCGYRHRLENPGKIPLVLIEVQSGEYLGEDDIVRFEDQYGRVGEVDRSKARTQV